MKRLLFVVVAVVMLAWGLPAHTPILGQTSDSNTKAAKPKKAAFRPTKGQITEAQAMLKGMGQYSGQSDGRYNSEMRSAIKGYQKANGLRSTGSLNRATLERMGIELTEAQMAIPVTEDSFAKVSEKAPKQNEAGAKPKSPIFRATKDQIKEAQRALVAGGMYNGEDTGQLNKETREGLRKFQTANGLKATGTLNQVTLEKMGIELTDKQKGAAEPSSQ
jgi:peptidoglycan hydrolase-like protein with peptidoglycan-binding domain